MFRIIVRCTRFYLNQNSFEQNKCTSTTQTVRYIVNSKIICAKKCLANHIKDNPPDVQINPITQTGFFTLLQRKLKCPNDLATEICTNNPDLSDKELAVMNQNLKLLLQNDVTTQSILDNLWMLTLTHLEANLRILTDMEPKNINDIAPLLRVSPTKLKKIKKIVNDEKNLIPCENRIYYLSQMMKIEPFIISKVLSERLFIFELPFEKLYKNLNILLTYVAPKDILTDLWAFKNSPNFIESRMKEAKMGHKNKLRPWVARCRENILRRSIELASENKALLGEDMLVKYLSDQLKFDIPTIEIMLRKYPRVCSVRVSKIKEILDYLLNEAGYTPSHLVQVPRIFCMSLNTIKDRLKEVDSLNCRPASLNILCKSAKEYRKFIESKINRFKE